MPKNQTAGIKTADLPEQGDISAFDLTRAAGIATEIKEERSRLYCLASAITNHLDLEQPIALGLSEVLEELLGDCERINRLVELLSPSTSGAVLEPVGG